MNNQEKTDYLLKNGWRCNYGLWDFGPKILKGGLCLESAYELQCDLEQSREEEICPPCPIEDVDENQDPFY